jgi:predicted transcriptional regulator
MGDSIGKDIDEKIIAFAKQRRIKPEKFKEFRDSILNGLKSMGLRTDKIDLEKFKAIAKRNDAQELAKKQEVDSCQQQDKKQ